MGMKLFWELMPERGLGAITGAFAKSRLSRSIVAKFSKSYGIRLDEAEKSLESYSTLDDFFTRRLKPGVRQISDCWAVSPVDAIFRSYQVVRGNNALVEVKGRTYGLEELFGVDFPKDAPYTVFNFYLSPRHYHRIHHPVGGQLEKLTKIPGRLRPVHNTSLRLFPQLLFENARVVSQYQNSQGRHFMASVTALNVGEIEVTSPVGTVQKADEWGMFHLGSAIMLALEGEHTSSLKPHQDVLLGTALI